MQEKRPSEPDQPPAHGNTSRFRSFSQDFELNSVSSCSRSRWPCLPAGLGQRCPSTPFVLRHIAPNPNKGQKREVKRSHGKRHPSRCLRGKPAAPPHPGGTPFASIAHRSVGLRRSPSLCRTSALRRVRNTFQGAKSIQELLVLLQVHFAALLLSWVASGHPRAPVTVTSPAAPPASPPSPFDHRRAWPSRFLI